MASIQGPKVYRLQGIPFTVESSDEVINLLRSGREDLANYDIEICSLATGLVPRPAKVATVMFSIRQRDSKDTRLVTRPRTVAPAPDPLTEVVSRVKDGLILDNKFLGATPLNDVGLDDHEFDCIAISGIASHPFGSWQPHGGDKRFMWIRDALPKAFPFARVILYGYDTELRNTISFQRVRDIAMTLIHHLRAIVYASVTKRPLVFIAHSLGGIVLKEALVLLADSHQLLESKLLEAVSGAIFFGVPNHGMVISHLVALAAGRPNNFLVEQLKEKTPYLQGLEARFELFSREGEKLNQKIFFWGYETKESVIPAPNYADGSWSTKNPNAPRLKLVDRESATRGLWRSPERRHFAFQIDEDHSSMVKFTNMHDPNLELVINILSQIFERPLQGDVLGFNPQRGPPINSAQHSTSSFPDEEDAALRSNMGSLGNRSQTFKLPSESPNFPVPESLFGRDVEIETLAQLLGPRPTAGQQITSIHGPPGIGKTQFITHYVKRYRATYDNVFCIDGTTLERLRLTLRRETNRIRQSWSDLFFKVLGWPDTHSGNIERFCAFLNSDGNDKWLLVIDEMRDCPWIAGIFERLKQGFIALISTSSQFATRYPAVRLGPLEPVPSVQMLLHYSPAPDLDVKSDHHHLLFGLDRHPALIRLAVPKILGFKTIPIFIDHWQDGQIKMPSQLMTRVHGILEQEFPNGLPSCQKDLLELCLLFDHKAISYEFLEFLGFPSLQLFFENSERFARHGLIETRIPFDQSVTCSISAILYQYLRQSVCDWNALLMRAASALAPKVPRSSKDNYRVSIELLAPHAEIFAKRVINTLKSPSLNADACYLGNMERIASLLRLMGNDRDAIKLYGYIHRENKGDIHRGTKLSAARTAELYNNMGLSCLNDGDIKFAQSCFERATNALEGKPVNSQTMLEVIANRARAHIEVEEYCRAVPLLVDSISKFQTEEQDVLLPLQHALGFAHIQLGQSDLGVRILEQSCQTALKSPRAGKRLAYSIMHDLATAYRDQKKWDTAINLYEKTREGRRSIHGPRHRYTMETIAALAVAYHGSGQRGKAAACFQEALKWQRENLRPNHSDTLQTLQNYGIFLYNIDDLEAARKALQLVHIGRIECDEKIGKASWKKINSGVSLALVLQGLKKFKESASLFEEAVNWYKHHPSLESSKTAYQYSKTLYLQGMMYEEWTYLGQALESYIQADKVSDAAEGEINYWKQLAKKGIERLESCSRRDH